MNKYTRKLYFDHEEDRDKGPSINSDDLEERIAARQLRIAERLASLRPDYFDEKASTEEKAGVLAPSNPLANAQVALSAQRIVNLCRNGNAFITNLKVACDARENLRRVEEEELDDVRQAKLDAEQKAVTKLFEDVEEKWEEIKTRKGAHELHDIFEELKTNCAKIIDEKNKLIYDIHLELKAKDDHFVKELRKRTEDVDIMVERMESQMKSMQRAYDFELREIEKAFLQDREDLLKVQTNDWEDFMAELKKKQENYLEERKNRIAELEELIQRLRTNHSEEFNALKLRLTTEVQNMETDLQQMKATYQLNLEKLEYNFQVLKRRDEENTFTRSQQKRKITQLQDQLNRLRVFSKKQKEFLRSLIKFEEQNFRDIWIMNEDELRKDAEKLMAADKIIMEQQLGLTWTPPNVLPQTLKEAPKDIVDKFLTMLAFEPEFLIEVKMKKLLRGLPFDDQKLIRLDAVLNVLKVNSERLLDKLFTYFILPCDENRPKPLPISLPVSSPYGQDAQQEGGKNELQKCESQSTTPPDSLAPTEVPTFNEEVSFSVIRLIDPIDVPQVLHRFAVENCVHGVTLATIERAVDSTAPVTASLPEDVIKGVAEKGSAVKIIHRVSARQQDLLDMEMDREHWHKYLRTFAPDEKKMMWAGLKRALQHYLSILQARSRLIVDNAAMRNQNTELRHLLKLYSQSQGTNTDQDSRFADKKKKLLKSMKFGDNLNEKVDTQRVNVESIKPWIVKRITELLSYEDDIVCDFVVNMLSEQFPDPKDIQINLTAFLGSKSARIFVTELWDLLLSAMNTTGGVPAILLEARKVEILGSKVVYMGVLQAQEERFRAEQASRQLEGGGGGGSSGGVTINRPREHGDGPSPTHPISPAATNQRRRSPSPPRNERKEVDSRSRNRRRYSSSPDSESERSRSRRRRREEEDIEAEVAEQGDWDRRRRRHRRSYSRSPSSHRRDYHRHHHRHGHHSPRDRRYEEVEMDADIRSFHERRRPRSREGRRPREEERERAVHNADGPICVPRAGTPSPPHPPTQRQQPSPVTETKVNGEGTEESVERPHRSGRSPRRGVPRSSPREDRSRRTDEVYREDSRAYKERSSWRRDDSHDRRRSSRLTMENETYVEEHRRHDNHEGLEDRIKARQRRDEKSVEEREGPEQRQQRRIPPASSSRRRSPEGPILPPGDRDRRRGRREGEDAPLVSPEGPELPKGLVKQRTEEEEEKARKIEKKTKKRRTSSSSSSSSSSSTSSSSSSLESSSDDESSDSSSDSDSSSNESDSSSSSSSSSDDSDVRTKGKKRKHSKAHEKPVIDEGFLFTLQKSKSAKRRKVRKHKAKEKSIKKKRETQVLKEGVKKNKRELPQSLSPEGPKLPPPVEEIESPGVEWKERRRGDDVNEVLSSTSSSSSEDSYTDSSSSSSSSLTSSSSEEKREILREVPSKRSRQDDDFSDGDKERGRKRNNDVDITESRSGSGKRRRRGGDVDFMEGDKEDDEVEVDRRRGSSSRSEEDRLRRRALESLKRKNAVVGASRPMDSS
ncbi:unnamed protein product [Hydatigera taeniaeformis]|uniref:PWI domain-containing protein n=1 Tax=Hydatigena taeniaeformis TaxID=6205 RepID=A0A158RE19_HYDTA|nr:unnamed protein product [Hydatigera taeniaeformis]